MKNLLIFGLVFMCCAAKQSIAQELLGKYSGSFTIAEVNKVLGMSVEITNVDSGKLTGVLSLHRPICGGSFPMEGTYEGNKFQATTSGAGVTRDCADSKLTGSIDGKRLVGKLLTYRVNWVDISLSK